MNQEKEQHWISQKLFNCIDNITGTQLELSLDMGMTIDKQWGNQYAPMRANFVIRDARQGGNGRISIDFQHEQMSTLLNDAKYVLKDGMDVALQQGRMINVHRFYYKNKKDMQVKVINRNGPKIQIKITDNSTSVGSNLVVIEKNTFVNICNVLGSVRDDYASISTGIVSALGQERMVKNLSDSLKMFQENAHNLANHVSSIDSKLNSLLNKFSDQSIQQAQYDTDSPSSDSYVEKPKSESNPNEEKPEISPSEPSVQQTEPIKAEATLQPSEIQSEFSAILNNIDDVQLEDSDSTLNTRIPNKVSSKNVNNVGSVFIENFLSNDLFKLKAWIAGFLNSNDMMPFNDFMNASLIPNDEQNVLRNSLKYNELQSLIKKFTLNSIRDYVLNNIKEYPIDIPIVKFDTCIFKSSEVHVQDGIVSTDKIYKMVQEMMVVLLVYNLINTSCLNYLSSSSENSEKVGEYKRSYFVFKVLALSFIMSLHIEDVNKFKEEIMVLFNGMHKYSGLDNLKNDYHILTCGGTLNVNSEMFSGILDKFMTIIDKTESVRVDDFDNLYTKYGIANEEEILNEGSPVAILEEEVLSEPTMREIGQVESEIRALSDLTTIDESRTGRDNIPIISEEKLDDNNVPLPESEVNSNNRCGEEENCLVEDVVTDDVTLAKPTEDELTEVYNEVEKCANMGSYIDKEDNNENKNAPDESDVNQGSGEEQQSPNNDIEKIVEKTTIEGDKRWKIFYELCNKAIGIDPAMQDIFKETNEDYNNLTEMFKTRSLPEPYYVVKRVMDMNENDLSKSSLAKKIKDFSEDFTITQARVLQQDSIIDTSEDNIFDLFG